MVLYKTFQDIVIKTSQISGAAIHVLDENANIVASSNPAKIGTSLDFFYIEFGESRDIFVHDSFTYKPFGQNKKADYAVCFEDSGAIAEKIVELTALSLSAVKQFHDENHDKNYFIQNILFNNIIHSDINSRAKELRFQTEARRVVFVIKYVSGTSSNIYEILRNLFPDKKKDFVLNKSDAEFILVKELSKSTGGAALDKLAEAISDTFTNEHSVTVHIGVGNPVEMLADISKSYNEAATALLVGQIFDEKKTIVRYDNLGIAQLIYHLSPLTCQNFINEVFKYGSIDQFDKETITTILRFFGNNLNVSETSRKLFIHRNTLIYRLDKIKRLTGLDLREFNHAIIFKIALMVQNFIELSKTSYKENETLFFGTENFEFPRNNRGSQISE